MVAIKLNSAKFSAELKNKLDSLSNPEYLFRPVLFGLVDLMTKRIHNNGIAADGSAIGNYSSGYLKKRESKKYNRLEGSKVVISLTRQLEGDWNIAEESVIKTTKGYGIAFLTKTSFDKSQWVEATYKKKIFALTKTEREYAIDYITELANEAIK